MAPIVELACPRSSDRCWSEHVTRQPDSGAHGHECQRKQKHDQSRQQGRTKEGQCSGAGADILLNSTAQQQSRQDENAKPTPG